MFCPQRFRKFTVGFKSLFCSQVLCNKADIFTQIGKCSFLCSDRHLKILQEFQIMK